MKNAEEERRVLLAGNGLLGWISVVVGRRTI